MPAKNVPYKSEMNSSKGVGDYPKGARGGSAATSEKAHGAMGTLTDLPGRLARQVDQGVSMTGSTMDKSGQDRLRQAAQRSGTPQVGKATGNSDPA